MMQFKSINIITMNKNYLFMLKITNKSVNHLRVVWSFFCDNYYKNIVSSINIFIMQNLVKYYEINM